MIKTYRKETCDRNAYCRNCGWTASGLTANSKARYHTKKTGHTVDIYTEYRSVVFKSK